MKRLMLFSILVIFVLTVIAFPIRSANANNSAPQKVMLSESNEAPGNEAVASENTTPSLSEAPIWAKILVITVVGLFGFMMIVPLLLRENETG